MQRTLNTADADLYAECAAAAARGETAAGWPTVGYAPAGVEGVRRKLIGIQAAGAAEPQTVLALLADLIRSTVSGENAAGEFTDGIAVQSGLGRSGSAGALVTVLGGDNSIDVTVDDAGVSVNGTGAGPVQFDGDATASLATVIALGVTAAECGFVDALATSVLPELREAKSKSSDRWAGQALRHEIANAVMNRDIALLHALHALEEPLESSVATTYSLLSLVEGEKGLDTALAMARSLAGVHGDHVGIRRTAQIRDVADRLSDLAGSGVALRQWIYGVAVQHA